MSEAGKKDGAAGQPHGSSELPLRSATPARSPMITDLRADDPVRIGEHRLVGQLGIGGMGTVYLGQSDDGSRVAIKLVHTHLARDPRFRMRFAGEVRAAQRVPGFCTARVLSSGVYEERPYLVTEYLEGVPLSRLVADDGPLDPAMLQSVAIGVAAALAAIHGVGLVHRDMKPSNLMVTLGGVRIIDFGIARAMDVASDVTGTGNIVGSLGWASPEQLRAEEPKPSMDIFGWGCLVAFAATGRHPFGGEEAAARAWRILEGEPDLSGIPDPVRGFVAAALDRDPEARPDAQQLLVSLAAGELAGHQFTANRRWLRGGNGRRRATTMAVAVPLALALVFAAAETTSELIGAPGGVADAGTPGGGRDNAMTNILSPQITGGPNMPTGGNNNGRNGRTGANNGPNSLPTMGGPGPTHTFGGVGGNPTDTAVPPTTTPAVPPTTPAPTTTDPTTDPPTIDPTPPPSSDTAPPAGQGGSAEDTNTPGPTDTGTPVTIPVDAAVTTAVGP
jgi:serine/threonine protein kinase